MVVNTKSDFGGAYNNREYGFHYFISPSDSYRASKTFAHEFGHGLLGLGDEYSNGYLLDDKELKSLNLSSVEDPEKIKWRQLLGFRNTYTCRNAYGSKMLVSSYECIMRDTNYQFCEVCRLQGFKRMSQLVKDVDLYVATPEVKEYTGAYSKPSDFTDLETSSYYNYTYNRNDRLLSGNSKSRFNTNMNGKKIELRTVIQNISDKNARQLKFKMWIKHSDGSVATDSSGNPLQTVQTFDIPVWNDKANFWPLGALDHIKSDFNSGLKSCSLIYQIPSDAQLKSGDTVAFQVLDENGNVLAESKRFTNETIYSEFDVERIETERRRMTTFVVEDDHRWADFDREVKDPILSRYVNPAPFVPADKTDRDRRCDEILMIQAMGLKKRLEHTNCKTAVIGISGGLDSTLALLVTVRAFDLLGKDHKDIAAVTMPGFGTTDRTYDNAVNLIKCLGATFIEVDIKDAVNIHFRDIGQNPSVHDVTYENGQARERTQILMDIANKENGMVIGTGDLSELALGWATYNGDHMSMYAVNASVPKTLVRHLVKYYADTCGCDLL